MSSKTETLVRLRVGHVTKKLPHPTEQQHTHRWTVFVRATGEEFADNSFVRSVTFNLHDSFENPIVKVKQPPFEVTRTGWGGFMMVIGIQLAGVTKVYSLNFDLNFSLSKLRTLFFFRGTKTFVVFSRRQQRRDGVHACRPESSKRFPRALSEVQQEHQAER